MSTPTIAPSDPAGSGNGGSDSSLEPGVAISNPFQERLKDKQITSVIGVRFVTSNELPMMVRMTGHHGLFIDMEHSMLDMRTVGQLCIACNYAGVSPIVRSPSKSQWHISRILDSGAAAVVIPHIVSVQEVKDIVAAGKYAPIGHRGTTNNQPILNFQTLPHATYTRVLNAGTMIIPMIETVPSLSILDEILSIAGVDGLVVGANDLSAELEIPGQYDHPILVDAITKVIEAGNRANKPIGIGGFDKRKDLLEKYFVQGATWSLAGADRAILDAGLRRLGKEYDVMRLNVQAMRKESATGR
ncbi:hypothetical protein ABEF95_004829 [Exophiala dermatitidis]